jgi:kynurenine formamidase
VTITTQAVKGCRLGNEAGPGATGVAPDRELANFRAVFHEVSNWGRWGANDQLGTLNLLTPERLVRAAGMVRIGRAVPLGLPLNTVAGDGNPRPAIHHMTKVHDVPSDGPVRFARDFVGVDYHGDSHSHIDALCHVSFEGKLYNGQLADAVTSQGAHALGAEGLCAGIIGRGVLLDLAWHRSVSWLEPGTAVEPEELEAVEERIGVPVGQGDILVLRTGHDRRRREGLVRRQSGGEPQRAGLSIRAVRWMSDRDVAAFLPDGDGETVPSGEIQLRGAVHALQVAAMGMPAADSLELEPLSDACRLYGRWEFLVVVSPLHIQGGTGSPVNPIAVF